MEPGVSLKRVNLSFLPDLGPVRKGVMPLLREDWIKHSAEMPSLSCKRPIMPIDKLRLRLSTSARRVRVGCVVAGLININQYRPHVEPAPSGVSFAGAPQRRHVF